jgi:hypothetical protein
MVELSAGASVAVSLGSFPDDLLAAIQMITALVQDEELRLRNHGLIHCSWASSSASYPPVSRASA